MTWKQCQQVGIFLLSVYLLYYNFEHYYRYAFFLKSLLNFGMFANLGEFIYVNLTTLLAVFFAVRSYSLLCSSALQSPSPFVTSQRLEFHGNIGRVSTGIDCLLLALIIVVYHSFFWNKFVPVQEGWFHLYAELIGQGKIPYRDFNFFLQPTYLYLIHTITSLFGNTFIVMREFGIAERVILAIICYLIYCRLTNRVIAMLASAVSVIVYSGFCADPIYSYYQTCLIFVMLSTYLALKCMDLSSNQKSHLILLLCAGIAGGIGFSIKQTTGLLVPFMIGLSLLIFELKANWRHAWFMIIYAIGFLLPTLIICFLLYRVNALQDYVQQVFFSAANSKGGVGSIFLILFKRAGLMLLFLMPVALLLALWALFQRNRLIVKKDENQTKTVASFCLAIGIVLTLSFAYYLGSYFEVRDVVFYYKQKDLFLVLFFDIDLLLCLMFFGLSLRERYLTQYFQWFFLYAVSFSIVYCVGLSGGLNSYAYLLSVGLCIIILSRLKMPLNYLKNVFLYGACFTLIAGLLIQRTVFPYWWWGWKEPPVQTAHVKSSLPILKGFTLSKETNDMYENITQIIATHTQKSDTIYEFPHMPIFYLLTNKIPFTRSMVDYFDVCSDSCAEQTAAELMVASPKVIIVNNMYAYVWTWNEAIFRHGNKSGQRKIIAAIDQLTSTLHYTKMASYHSVNGTIDVWVR